jgi:glycosyltransferase involved in cell wall biosynthesis
MLEASGGGVAVPPDDLDEFCRALGEMLADLDRARAMGQAGRRWVEGAASPAAVAERYERLILGLGRRR